MEKIVQHIETLLRRHDFVIVPDFGGFVTQRQSAKIDDEQINPPVAVVGFNPLMNTSDGLLAIEISRAENKSFREAVQLIDTEVAALKHLLSQGKNVFCGNLGSLFLSKENKILFSPTDDSTFLPANYGLSALYYSKISNNTEVENKTVTISIPSRNKITRYAAVGIITIGLIFTAPKLNDARNTTASLSPASFVNFSDNLLKENNAAPTTEIASTQNSSITTTESTSAIPEKKFYVIVGCMATQKKAEEICNHLKENNFHNAFILPRIKTYRVAIESFTTEKDAVNYMGNLRKTNREFHDAWVLNF